MLKRDEVMNSLRTAIPTLKQRFGIKDVKLFGSIVRNEAREGSDVDLLVDFESGPTFDQFMDLKYYLEELLQSKVDLVTSRALKPRMRPIIENEALRVA